MKTMKSYFLVVFLIALVLFSCSKVESNDEPTFNFSKLTSSEVHDLVQTKYVDNLHDELQDSERRKGETVPNDGEGASCPMVAQTEVIGEEDEFYARIQSSYVPLYDLRDNVLQKSEKGRSYIEAFYHIGEILKEEEIVYSDVIRLATTLPYVVHSVEKFKEGNDNDIIIDEETKENLVHLLVHYQEKRRDDQTYQTMLEAIMNDVVMLTGRSKGQIQGWLE